MANPKKPEPQKGGITELQQDLLRRLPGVDVVLDAVCKNGGFPDVPKSVVTASARGVLDNLRKAIRHQPEEFSGASLSLEAILKKIQDAVNAAMTLNLDRVINATGVVVHTNLGRSLLCEQALDHLQRVGGGYSNLEMDLATGKRGSRYTAVEDLICEITGAESAMVVNNNAAAVLLSLDTVARDREVIVSRGELVEIGGSFRIPDVMEKSGAVLKEVGTTNRTHLFDYQKAVSGQTGLLLKVHASNFGIIGFTRAVPLKELVDLGKSCRLPVMEDLGSGTFIDFSRYGLAKEPTVSESVAAGADIVTFSGDKLLGGPQAGIIAGKKAVIDRVKQNPLNRALRIDKLTLAALESTLRAYRDEARAVRRIPTLRMLTAPIDELAERAGKLQAMMPGGRVQSRIIDASSRAGGGALPLLELPSKCLGLRIRGLSAKTIEARLRKNQPPIIARIEDDEILMDMRTVHEDELELLINAITRIAKEAEHDPPI